jgi:hypothetical protein
MFLNIADVTSQSCCARFIYRPLWMFIAFKNLSSRPGLNPRHLDLVASKLTSTPPRRLRGDAWGKGKWLRLQTVPRFKETLRIVFSFPFQRSLERVF